LVPAVLLAHPVLAAHLVPLALLVLLDRPRQSAKDNNQLKPTSEKIRLPGMHRGDLLFGPFFRFAKSRHSKTALEVQCHRVWYPIGWALFFLTRPKLTVFGIVNEANDTHMVHFLSSWHRQRGRNVAVLASLKSAIQFKGVEAITIRASQQSEHQERNQNHGHNHREAEPIKHKLALAI